MPSGDVAWLCCVTVWCNTGVMLLRQCQLGEGYGDSPSPTDPYNTWLYTPLYTEQGMPMLTHQVTPGSTLSR